MKVVDFFVGFLFGFGLLVSGMADPEIVLGFLNIMNNWNPSLFFTLGSALLISIMAFMYAKKREYSFLNQRIQMPSNQMVDKQLIVGSLVFGIGWGLSGFCPGTSIVLLGSMDVKVLAFFFVMTIGMYVFEKTKKIF